jgi:hypothetical protein
MAAQAVDIAWQHQDPDHWPESAYENWRNQAKHQARVAFVAQRSKMEGYYS